MLTAYVVLQLPGAAGSRPRYKDDAECLTAPTPYSSLMAMAHEVRKPMFHLRAAERRARRPHLTVQDHYHNFETIANSIAAKCDVNHSAGSPTCSVISTIHVQLPIVCKSTGDTVSATPHMAASSSRARTHRRAAKSAAQTVAVLHSRTIARAAS